MAALASRGLAKDLERALVPRIRSGKIFGRPGWQTLVAGSRHISIARQRAATLALYAFGLLLRNGQGKNYFFTFGGIVAVFCWRAFMRYARERISRILPTLADKIYAGKGTIYFSGALVGLLITAGLLALNLAAVAEQVAVVVYYFLVTGTVLEIVELRRASKAANGLPGLTDQNKAN
jgi:hypothetical protein